MQKNYFWLTLAGLCLAVTSLFSADTVKEPDTGLLFPTEVSFNEGGKDYTLKMTGMAVRKKLLFKVYAIAHYLENPTPGNVIQEALSTSKAKEFLVIWNRDVPGDKIQSGWRESFERTATPEAIKEFQKEIDQLVGFFNNEMHKNDVSIYRFVPGGALEFYLNDKKIGEIKNDKFVPLFWNIWFSPKSGDFASKLTSIIK